MQLTVKSMEDIIDKLACGIIIMDDNRQIHYLNDQANELTGWQVGGYVPFCTYCQKRKVELEKDRCLLTADDTPIPFFNSHMAVYTGKEREFEMTVKKINIENTEYQMLHIRCPNESELQKDEFSELLIQEAMLAQEVERRRIARELHDHIGQNIYSIFLGLEGIKYLINDEIYEEHFKQILDVMDNTISNVKWLTKSLRPENIHHLGLQEALVEATKDWETLYNIEINLTINFQNKHKFNRKKELHIFRVIQEAVRNAVSHGNATKVSINLQTIKGNLFFKITDNGEGFKQSLNTNDGLGLKHMHERCKMMNGEIKWLRSKCGTCTIVEGFVPIVYDEGGAKNECFNCG